MCVAILLGGAGESYPFIAAFIRGLGVAILAYFAAGMSKARPTKAAFGPLLLLIAIVAVPLVHLIPLPAELWTRLPGRDLPLAIRAAADISIGSQPLSLAPDRTRDCALDLLPAAAAFIAVLHLQVEARLRLLWIIVAGAVASTVLGALQITSGAASAVTPFPSIQSIHAPGLFVNRNHQATLLVIGGVLVTTLGMIFARRQISSTPRWFAFGTMLFLAAGVIPTASRTGALLLMPALAWAILVSTGWRLRGRALILTFGIFVTVIAAFSQSSGAEKLIARFNINGESRLYYWPDVVLVIREYFPVGAGLGAFESVYLPFENLNHLGPGVLTNAHNDYLEILAETGIVGAILYAFFIGVLIFSLRDTLRPERPAVRDMALGSSVAILLILLHSFVDYPLRMLSIETIFAVLCGMTVRPPESMRGASDESGTRSTRKKGEFTSMSGGFVANEFDEADHTQRRTKERMNVRPRREGSKNCG